MPVFNNALAGAAGSGGAAGYEIERSLRFNRSDSAYLSKNFGTAGNRKKWTYSTWVKRAKLGTEQMFGIERQQGNNAGYEYMRFDASDRIDLYLTHDGSNWSGRLQTTRVFRDTSAWLHVVLVCDIENTTSGDRIRLYVNGERVTVFDASGYPATTEQTTINSTGNHHIGRITANSQYYGGYLADVYFLDGQALDPTAFGEFDEETGVWNPIDFTGSYDAVVNQTQNWSALGSGDATSPYRWEETFDGDSSTYGAIAPQNSALNLDLSGLPGGGLSYSQSVAITYNRNSSAPDVTVNGSAIGATADGTDRTYTITGSGTLTSVGGQTRTAAGSGDMGIKKIVVDGKELVDSGVSVLSNSFHLDFDPTAGVVYSDAIQNANNAATNLFDGSLSSYTEGSTDGTAVTWTGNVTGNTIEFYGAQNAGTRTFSVNGVDRLSLVPTTAGWFTIPNTTSLTSFSFSRGAPSGGFVDLYAIRVDGKILVDHEAPGVDASGAGNHWTATNLADSILYAGNAYNGSLNGYMPSGVAQATDPSQLASTSNRTHFFLVNQDNSINLTVVATATSMTVGSSVYDAWGANNPTTTLDNGTVTPNSSGTDSSVSGKNLATNTFTGLTVGNTYTISTKNGGAGNPHRIHYVTGATVQNQPIVDTNNLIDSPTGYGADSGNNGGNYATLNALQTGSGVTLSNGNLDLDGTSSWKSSYSSIFLKSGKWYTEYTIRERNSGFSYGIMVGLAGLGTNSIESEIGSSGDSYAIQNGPGDMKVNHNGTSSGQGPQDAYAVGDVLQLAWDADNGKLFFGKNGSWINSGNPVTGANAVRTNLTGTYCFAVSLLTTTDKISANFGQRPFVHTIPTGYKSVCTQNLDDSLIANGSNYFDVSLYTGNGTTGQSITGLEFSPDLVWLKERNGSAGHSLLDTVRGVNKPLMMNTNDEYSKTEFFESFDSNGFTVDYNGVDSTLVTNRNLKTYAAWSWDGGDLVTNSAYNQSEVWSGMTSTSGNYSQYSTFGPEKLFNGSTSDGWQFSGTTASAIFTPTSPISYSSQVRVYIGATGNINNTQWKVNSGSYQSFSSSGAQWLTVLTGSGTFSRFELYQNGDAYTMQMAAIEIDGKLLVNPGVIPPGSANSSAYNDGEVWSTTGTLTVDLNGTTVSTMTGPLTKAFEGSLASSSMVYEGTPYTSGTKTYTYTFGTAQTNITSARVYLYQGNSAEGGATGFGNGTINKTQDGTYGWVDASSTIPSNGTVSAMTMTTTATSGVNSSRNGFIAIELNGKILLDNGVTPVDNFPSIPSTVRVNPTAGFSIVSFTGTGSAQTTAHGLNATPGLVLLKNRDSSNTHWQVFGDGYERLQLTTTQKELGGDYTLERTSTTISPTQNSVSELQINQSGDDFIAYCFAPVEGYSAMGTWVGNYSSNGPFVYTGFRPAFLMWKNITNDGFNWGIIDSTRGPFNYLSKTLNPNIASIESSRTASDAFDFLSNGFKVRASGSNARNQSGATFMWYAVAENPFKIARAR